MLTESKLIEATRASEQGHWYAKDGSPCYTIIGKNGKERNVNLRDARSLGLVPSVTTILQCANKPNLINWFQEQAIMSALTLPRIEGESDSDLIARIKYDAGERARKARERGTLIHAWVQQGFEWEEWEELEGEALAFFQAAKQAIISEIGDLDWLCEQAFAHVLGYGGKCDLHLPIMGIVLDIKTTDKSLDTLKLWDDHHMQLAAYRQGLGLLAAKCGILYVNSVEPQARLVWAEEKELVKGWKKFTALLNYWYADKGMEII